MSELFDLAIIARDDEIEVVLKQLHFVQMFRVIGDSVNLQSDRFCQGKNFADQACQFTLERNRVTKAL